MRCAGLQSVSAMVIAAYGTHCAWSGLLKRDDWPNLIGHNDLLPGDCICSRLADEFNSRSARVAPGSLHTLHVRYSRRA